MEIEKTDLTIKIVLVGESSVGKTNLLLRYSENRFDQESKATIGMDFVSVNRTSMGQKVKAQFWDTAGQEKYKALSASYYKITNGVILVYDVSRRESFNRVVSWLNDLTMNAPRGVQKMLIGNKIDTEREVSTEEGRKFAKDNNMFFFETSAKTNHDQCVNVAFDIVVEECVKELVAQNEKNKSIDYNEIKHSVIALEDPTQSDPKPCPC